MLSGLLPRPEMTMSMMGITFNVHALCFFAAHGLSGAASTRVGNELGERARQAGRELCRRWRVRRRWGGEGARAPGKSIRGRKAQQAARGKGEE